MSLTDKAERFRALHHGPSVLVLPNAWDAASARIIEDAGFLAVATTSAGVAFSLGHPAGQNVTREEMLGAVARITRAVQVPVTADVEAGYGAEPEAVAQTVRGVLEAGAVGINLEDSWAGGPLVEIPLQQDRIRAARAAAETSGISLVINARTDVYLRDGEDRARLEEAVRRLNAYIEAGADCAFPIGALHPDAISSLVAGIRGPVNILARPGAPPIAELQRLGVARVSFGAWLTRAAMGLTRHIARTVFEQGSYAAFPEDAVPSLEANRLFRRR